MLECCENRSAWNSGMLGKKRKKEKVEKKKGFFVLFFCFNPLFHPSNIPVFLVFICFPVKKKLIRV